MSSFLRDVRVAARVLLRAPGFSLVVILSLGVGVALAVATLAVVNAYLLRSMPFPAAERLFQIAYSRTSEPAPRELEKIDWAALGDVVEVALASDPDVLYLTEGGFTERANSALVSAGYLEGLGVRPALGRTLRESDATTSADRVALISHALWRNRFGMRPDILGRQFRAYSAEDTRATFTLTVVGVLPPEFWTSRPTDVMLPLRTGAVTAYSVRLRDGVTIADAERRIADAVRAAASAIPPTWSGVRLRAMQEQYAEPVRPMLVAISFASAIALAIVCANVIVLLLLRSTRRQKEVAVRLALGAGRGQVMRMIVAEALILTAAATAIGVAVTAAGLRTLAPIVEQNLGRVAPGGTSAIAIDGAVLVAVGGIGSIVALALTLAPALASSRHDLFSSLRRDDRGGTGSVGGRRLRSFLTAAEVAGSVALLVGCGLLVRTALHLAKTDLGIDTTAVVAAQVTLPAQAYPTPAALAAFYGRLQDEMRQPATFTDWPVLVEPIRHPIEADGADVDGLLIGAAGVSPRFFETFGIDIIEGRQFSAADRIGSEPVAMISQSLARRLWPNGGAVGRRIRTGEELSVRAPLGSWRTVVGVVADVRQTVTDSDLRDVYLPFEQVPNRFTTVLFEADRPLAEWLGAFRRSVAAIDDEVAVSASPTPSAAAARQLAGPRFLAALFTGFAIFTALLALLGLYGVVAYAIQQRQREVAIRMALGATGAAVTTLLVRHGATILAVGLATGLVGAIAVARLLQAQIHGVAPFDAATFAATAALLGAAGLIASWWPARRAARSNPLTALKAE
jgi:predicted permease